MGAVVLVKASIFWMALMGGLGGTFLSSVAHASPWGQMGGAYVIINRFDQYWSSAEDRSFKQSNIQIYGEAGLPKKLTVGGKATYTAQHIERPGFEDHPQGISEAEVFLQRRLMKRGRSVLSAKAAYAAPTQISSALVNGVNTERDGAVQLSGLYGWSTGPIFVGGEGGYRHSFGGDADQMRLNFTLGHKARNGRLVLVELFNTISVTDPAFGGVDYDLVTLSPSIVLPARGKHKLQLGATIDLHGRNVDNGYSAFISFWKER